MRLIQISDYQHQTMVLAKPVYDKNKRILLAAGRTIDPKIKARLENMGINFLFIEDEVSKGITIDDMLDMPTWTDAIQIVQAFYQQAGTTRTPDIQGLQQVANQLIQEVKNRPTLVMIPTATMTKELQPYAHSVNVAILGLLIGKKLSYNDVKLRDLAIGCLLHDIGKELTDTYEDHPEQGFHYIRGISQLSALSAHVAYQHHERFDGKGFPRQITGKDFIEFGQIGAIADRYDHLISIEKIAPHDAMEAIMASSGTHFSHPIVTAFSRSVLTYPPGTKVRTNHHEQAIVTEINKHLQRPKIKILATGNEIDLTKQTTYVIQPHETA
ncbi:HD-GYP domain-containing protein [Aquibacillus sediminis]|uniref:HD-GYP domain-containing protein n=1 Tax=Aquibacillus sediminis TaxID=2574734 RepID=UPI0011084318|nr:HD domain-containing phosphohydrolase [Aquibacillus sediminis]